MIECPNCRSLSTIPIVYGKSSVELQDAANRKLCELSDCVFEDGAPTRRCLSCKHIWNEECGLEVYSPGYFVLLMYEADVYSLKAIKRHVRVSNTVDRENAEALADAIILEINNRDDNPVDILGWSNKIGSEFGMWQRRLAQYGGIDEFSGGVQATYFSPAGVLVSFLAYYNAEWLDE